MRQQRDVRLDAEQLEPVRGLQRGLDDLLHARVFLHVRVQEEEPAQLVDHPGHRRGRADPRFQRDHAARIAELLVEAADHAGEQRIGFAARDHHCGDQRRPRAHQLLGRGDGDAAALGQ